MSITLTSEARVVAVVAHPDDDALMFYGTLRLWRSTGATVTVLVATHGANGVSVADHAAGLRLTTTQRLTEIQTSYQDTGIAVECLGLEDGALIADRELVTVIEAELIRLSCTVLLTHALHTGVDHQDHLAVARAALNAAARVPTCTTILHGKPHAPRHEFTTSVLVDITPYMADKIKALQAHGSQAGRYYLTEDYTRWRAAGPGWTLLPTQAGESRSFEELAPSLLLLSQPAEPRR
ncbi:PIG-L family deacetylase [Kitasatospora sp. GP82]|uniref:PIG-L deacetylase family protein n=1 Tax=Kitasatospora sp. GP82 TaxID=3035089 RepID=UPI0024767313|nr:PIG-L family deacetylase [Kitasatospora sp. GP82]MDH6130257.1 LmbE family N-acetylglucosaminyl deacetylase [Kitasatospora sp. GP82]